MTPEMTHSKPSVLRDCIGRAGVARENEAVGQLGAGGPYTPC